MVRHIYMSLGFKSLMSTKALLKYQVLQNLALSQYIELADTPTL